VPTVPRVTGVGTIFCAKIFQCAFVWKIGSSKTVDFIDFSAVLSVGIPQAKWELSDNFNH